MKILIIGAGPAGSTAAIELCKMNFEVTLIDRAEFPRSVPGESLLPDCEDLFKHLGIIEEIEKRNFIRSKAIEVITNNKVDKKLNYSDDNDNSGYQIPRIQLDSILLEQAVKAGAVFVSKTRPVKTQCDKKGNISFVETNKGKFYADIFIDATGTRSWLSNELNINFKKVSYPKIVYYGYVKSAKPIGNPKMYCDDLGWTWISQIENNILSWARLDINGKRKITKDWLPEQLIGFAQIHKRKAIDCTWRIAEKVSRNNYFFVGDAACVIDPASNRGVLNALVSSIFLCKAAQNVDDISDKRVHESYNKFMNEWFDGDVKRLSNIYTKRGFKI